MITHSVLTTGASIPQWTHKAGTLDTIMMDKIFTVGERYQKKAGSILKVESQTKTKPNKFVVVCCLETGYEKFSKLANF